MKNSSPQAPFRVYNASAGAGKTFALVKDFLKISLGSSRADRFKQILAITFTNKAAAEMKARVLLVLETIGTASSTQAHPMISMLMEELSLDFETLQERAQATLHSILHNYSLLGISTIDTFTNKLIRSFSRELQISANYEVELDVKGLLHKAVQLMLENLREGQADTKILKGFLRQRMRDEKSPKIEQDIVELMKNVYYDEHSVPYLHLLESLSTDQFIEIEKKLRAEQQALKKQSIEIARTTGRQLDAYRIEESLFQGNGNFPKILRKIEDGDKEYLTRTPTASAILTGEKDFYTKGKAKQAAPLFDPIADELRNLLLRADEKIKQGLGRIEVLDKILQNFYAMAVIRQVESYLEELKENSNLLPIGEFNRIISEHIREQPAPFLYEKLGERYQHFFIDEFQDTSRLQWQNLVPLINNALAGGQASALIVGDAKQAIYRFRGGEAKQFVDIARDEEYSNKVKIKEGWRELYAREQIPLKYNFRSRQNVVAFNNHFFEFCSNHEGLPEGYNALYAQARQEACGEEGGYVELTLYNKDQDAQREDTLAKIVETIHDCRGRGFAYRDICLLVRSKANIEIVSFYLREKNIPFVGSDSLQLSQSPVVRGLMSLLQMLAYPQDEQMRVPFLELLFANLALPEEEHYHFMKKWGKAPLPRLWQYLEKQKPHFNRQAFNQAGAYQRLSTVLRALDEIAYSNPYLQKFLDEVLSLQDRYGPALTPITDWWQQQGREVSISLPENTDALRLDTIHKSKGLEFPVVIVPYADWELFGKHTNGWLPLAAEENYGLPCAYIKLKRKTDDILHDGYAQLCEQEGGLQLMDNLNLLYVALTRAVDELYVIAKEKSSLGLDRFFKSYLEHKDATETFATGKKVNKTKTSETTEDEGSQLNVANYRPQPEHSALRMSSNAPRHWQENTARTRGRMVHHILSLLQPQVPPAELLQNMAHIGAIDAAEIPELLPALEAVLQHEELQTFFSPTALQVLAERDILLPKGGTQRPDRVVIHNHTAHVLDYKTGSYRDEDIQQVNEYMSLLEQMGYRAGERALVYVGETPQVEKW